MKTTKPSLAILIAAFAAAAPAQVQRPNLPATPTPATPLEQADTLLHAYQGSLFKGETASAADRKLADSVRRDIETMDYGADPKGREVATSIFGSNPLTSDANPLLTQEARKKWLAAAISNLGYEKAAMHMREQAEMLKSGKVDRQHWYQHVAQCSAFCSPVVQGLLVEHVQQVASLPHLLLTFPTSSASLSSEEAAKLRDFLKSQREKGYTRILLEGRGSRIGNREYNRTLSAQRVEAVKSYAERDGVSEASVHGFWLGYEPPQLTDEIARIYQLDPHLEDVTRNQSVLVVAFGEPVEAVPPSKAPHSGASR